MRWSMQAQDHLEISCVHVALNPLFLQGEGPILETAELVLHDEFYGRIEMAHIADPAVRRKLAQRADRCKVSRTFLAQPTVFAERLNPHSADRDERERAIRRLADCLEEAAEIGADMMALCSGPADGNDSASASGRPIADGGEAATGSASSDSVEGNAGNVVGRTADCLAYYADAIAALHEKAVALDIRLVLEPFDDRLDKKRLFGATDLVLSLMGRLPSEWTHFSILADLSHIPLLEEDVGTTVSRLAPFLGHVHIGNGVSDRRDGRFGDSHPYFGYPGGRNDTPQVSEFLAALMRAGYLSPDRKRTLGIEIIPAADEDARDLLAGAKRTLRSAWSRAVMACEGSV